MESVYRLRLYIIISTLLILLGVGTVMFHLLENYTWIQAFYFSVTTMTTVGYGDLVPSHDGTRLAVALYILISVSLYVSLITHVGFIFLERREKRATDRK
ncbi:MAG: potassium channel family protein [Pseudomonadota bacterium]